MAEETITTSPTNNLPAPAESRRANQSEDDLLELLYHTIIRLFGNIGYAVLIALRIGLMVALWTVGNARYQELYGRSYWVSNPDTFSLVYWTHVVEAILLIGYSILFQRHCQPLTKNQRKIKILVYGTTLFPHLLFAVVYLVTNDYYFIGKYSLAAYLFSFMHAIALVVGLGLLFLNWWRSPKTIVHRVKMMNAIHLLCEMGTDLGHFIFEHYF